MANEIGAGDRQVELHKSQAESGMVAAVLGYAFDEAKRELQRRPRAEDHDVASDLADVIDFVIRGYGDELTQPEKRQLSEALWTALLPHVPGNCV
jgi:hypothetical protein